MVRLRQSWLRWPLLALAALGLMAIGYVVRGGGTSPKNEVDQVRAVVNSFANAADARACDLLTNDALDGIYGGKGKCVKRSKKFQAGAVRISRAIISVPDANVKAISLDGRTLFTIHLQRVSRGCRTGIPGNPWLISSVKSAPNV
jgi:hypothetical protein